jgi:hypothetical protein
MTKTKKGEKKEGKAQECSGCDRNKKNSSKESKLPFPVILVFFLAYLGYCLVFLEAFLALRLHL